MPRPRRWQLRRRLSGVQFGLVLILAGLAACSQPDRSLRVGLTIWPGSDGIRLAGKLGYFGDHPIHIISLPSSTEVLRALRDGVIDVAGLTADEELLAAQQYPEHPPRAVLVLDLSAGADVVLARPPLARMQDLKGKRVGVEATALGGLVLARALELNGMHPSDITPVMVPLFDHERAFRDREVDAIVTFEPRASRLLASGAIRVFDSSQIPGEIVDLLVVREDALVRAAPTLRALVTGWFQAQAHTRDQPAAAGIQFPDLAANRRMLGPGSDNLTGTLRKLSAIMLRQGLLKREPDPVPLLHDEFLPATMP